MHNVSPATAKKKNNFASCITILLRADFLPHSRKILLNTARMKVNKCFGEFFCHVCVCAAAFETYPRYMRLLSGLIKHTVCLKWLHLHCPVCVLHHSALHIHSGRGAKHPDCVWLEMKSRHSWNQVVLLLPNDLKFAFIFRVAIMFLSLHRRSEISHDIFIKVAFMPCDVVSCVHLVQFVSGN